MTTLAKRGEVASEDILAGAISKDKLSTALQEVVAKNLVLVDSSNTVLSAGQSLTVTVPSGTKFVLISGHYPDQGGRRFSCLSRFGAIVLGEPGYSAVKVSAGVSGNNMTFTADSANTERMAIRDVFALLGF